MDPFTLALLAAGVSGAIDIGSEPGEFRQYIKGMNRQKSRVREGQRMANIQQAGDFVGEGVEGGSLQARRNQLLNQPYESEVAEIKRAKRHKRKRRAIGTLKKLAGIVSNVAGGVGGLQGGAKPGAASSPYGDPNVGASGYNPFQSQFDMA